MLLHWQFTVKHYSALHKIERSEDKFVVFTTSQQLSSSLVDTTRPGSHDLAHFGESGRWQHWTRHSPEMWWISGVRYLNLQRQVVRQAIVWKWTFIRWRSVQGEGDRPGNLVPCMPWRSETFQATMLAAMSTLKKGIVGEHRSGTPPLCYRTYSFQ